MRYQELYEQIAPGHYRPIVHFYDGIPCDTKVDNIIVSDSTGELHWVELDRPVYAINICRLLEHIDPKYFEYDGDYDGHMAKTELAEQKMREWAKRNNFCFYAAPREDFTQREALSMAYDNGFDGVIMEDLS